MTLKRKIITSIIAAFFFTALLISNVACDTQQGMMHGNNSMGMNNWNSTQTFTVLGIVGLVGLILWFAISRRKK